MFQLFVICILIINSLPLSINWNDSTLTLNVDANYSRNMANILVIRKWNKATLSLESNSWRNRYLGNDWRSYSG
jgi:hypothetical protein